MSCSTPVSHWVSAGGSWREIVPAAGVLEPGDHLVARRPQADADDREEGEGAGGDLARGADPVAALTVMIGRVDHWIRVGVWLKYPIAFGVGTITTIQQHSDVMSTHLPASPS